MSLFNKKSKFFITLIYIFFTLIIFLYVVYKDFYIYGGQFSEFYIVYYIILVIFFLLSLTTFFLNKKINYKIFIVLLSTLISFYIVEIILNFYPVEKKILSKKKDVLINEVYNFDDKNFIGPDFFFKNTKDSKFYPLSGIANLKTIYCNENGYWSTYQSDRYGFNNPDKIWNSLEIDYVLLGDSFTHGACVNYEDTFAGNISKFGNYNVLSLGISGNGPIKQYASYKEYLQNRKIKKIIWFYFSGNDLDDIVNELDNKILKKYYLDNNYKQNLIKNILEIENLKIKLLNSFKKKIQLETDIVENKKKQKKQITEYSIVSFFKLTYLRFNFLPNIPIKFFSLPDSDSLKAFSEILNRTKKMAYQNNSKLYFVYLPSKNRYTGNNYIFLEKILIERMVNKLNIDFIDIHSSLFDKINNPQSYYTKHFNEKGYKIVAKKVLDMIDEIEKK